MLCCKTITYNIWNANFDTNVNVVQWELKRNGFLFCVAHCILFICVWSFRLTGNDVNYYEKFNKHLVHISIDLLCLNDLKAKNSPIQFAVINFQNYKFGSDLIRKKQSYTKRIEMEPLKRFTQCGSLTMLFAVFIVLFGVSSTALTTFGKSPNPPPPPPTLPPGLNSNTHIYFTVFFFFFFSFFLLTFY